MPPDLFTLAVAALVVGVAGYVHRRLRGRATTLPENLRSVEVEGREVQLDHDWQPVANTDGELSVRLRSTVQVLIHEGEVPLTVVEVKGLAQTLALRLESGEPGGSSDFRVGDPEFDRVLLVRGPEPHLRAVLDSETRALVMRAFLGRVDASRPATALASDVRLANGVLQAKVDRTMELSLRHDTPGDTARALVDVARRLRHPERALVARLADVVRHDPFADVRLGALLLLLRDDPERAETIDVRRSALQDADPRIRLKAAEASGDEGRATLLALVRGEDAPDDVGAAAVAALHGALDGRGWTEVLEHAAARGRWGTTTAAIAAVAAARAKEAAPALLRLLREGHPLVAPQAVGALGIVGDPGAEAALLEALASELAALRGASARALGAIGTVASVPALRERESDDPDRDVRRAAREAVAGIRGRLSGAAPGQVALADADEGRVSLADDERGRVSEVPEPGEG